MAIISCPACNRPISDKAKQCPHCKMDFSNISPEDIQRKVKYQKFKRLQQLQNQSLVAILLFVIGAYSSFMGEFSATLQDRILYNLALGAMSIGFIWYAVNRVRIALAKRKR